MKIKEGASIAGLKIEMRKVLVTANALWKAQGEELVVTSGLEGEHSAGSLHPYGYAVDLRTRYFGPETKSKVCAELQKQLGSDYDVIVHKTHVHVEYDKILDQFR